MRELRAVLLALLLVCSLFATPVAASATVSPVAAASTDSHACPSHELVANAENGSLPAEPGLSVVVCDASGAPVPYAPVVVTAEGNYSAAGQLFLTDEDGVAVLPVASENVSLDVFAFTPTGDRAGATNETQLSANETAVIDLALASSPNQGPGGTSLAISDPLGAYALPEDAEPGELVTVRTVVLSPSSENRLSIADRYTAEDEPDVDLADVQVGGGNATVVLELDDDDGVDVAVEDVDGGAVITLLTNVTVPADATVGETVTVSGMVNTTDGDVFVTPASFTVVAPPAPPSPSPSSSDGPVAGPSTSGSSGGSSGGSAGDSSGGSGGASTPVAEPAEPSAVVTLADGQAFGELRDLNGSLDVPVDYTVDGVGVESMTVTSADADFEFDLRFADRPDGDVPPFLLGKYVPVAYLTADHTASSFESATLTLTVDAALVEDPETLRLYRHDGSWTALDTTFAGESDGMLTYTVETTDLGTFAVAVPGERPSALAGVARPATDGSDDYTLFLSVGYEGRASGALDLALAVNGELTDLERVHLVPGETETVRFTVETDGPGTYALSVNGRAVDTIEVPAVTETPGAAATTPTPEPVASETPAEDPAPTGSFPTAAVVGGVALVALAAGAFLVLRR